LIPLRYRAVKISFPKRSERESHLNIAQKLLYLGDTGKVFINFAPAIYLGDTGKVFINFAPARLENIYREGNVEANRIKLDSFLVNTVLLRLALHKLLSIRKQTSVLPGT
jgi:hypothetical protein